MTADDARLGKRSRPTAASLLLASEDTAQTQADLPDRDPVVPTTPWDHRLHAASGLVQRGAALLIVFFAGFALTGDSAILTYYGDLGFRAPILLGFVASSALVVVAGRRLGPARTDTLVALVLAVMYASVHARPDAGDGTWKTIATDGREELWMSSYLAHLLLRGLYAWFDSLPLYAPALGLLTVLGALFVLRTLHDNARFPTYVLTRLTFLGTGLHLAFFSNFVEVTMPALVVGVPAMAFLIRYTRADGSQSAHRPLAWATALYTLATCVHAQFLAMLPVLPLVVAARAVRGLDRRSVLRELSAALSSALAVVAIVGVTTVVFLGYSPVAGDSTGGFDRKVFAADFLQSSHRLLVGTALVLLVGGALVSAAIVVVGRRSRASSSDLVELTMGILALQYLAFVIGYGFDLGLPRDTELMIGLGIFALPVMTLWAERAAGMTRRWFVSTVAAGAAFVQAGVLAAVLRV